MCVCVYRDIHPLTYYLSAALPSAAPLLDRLLLLLFLFLLRFRFLFLFLLLFLLILFLFLLCLLLAPLPSLRRLIMRFRRL